MPSLSREADAVTGTKRKSTVLGLVVPAQHYRNQHQRNNHWTLGEVPAGEPDTLPRNTYRHETVASSFFFSARSVSERGKRTLHPEIGARTRGANADRATHTTGPENARNTCRQKRNKKNSLLVSCR